MTKKQKKAKRPSKEKLYSIIFFLSLIFIFFILLIIDHYTGFFTASLLDNKIKKIKGVECNVQTNVDDKTFISINFIIPYENWKQHSNIKKNMPKIRNEILGEMSTNLSDELSQKDFDKVKGKLVSIINKYTDEPVTEIYLDKFNLIDHPRGNLILD